MMTRSALDWSSNFPAIVDAIAKLPAKSAIVDGEAVILDDKGASHFASLQQAFAKGGGKARGAVLYAFDLLSLDGADLRREPLVKRREALARLLRRVRKGGALQLSETIDGDAEMILRHACKAGLEGIVSKRRDSAYTSGRSKDWLKTKCVGSDEFVIIGYVPSVRGRGGLGSLRVAVKKRVKLRFAGGVGTGFSVAVGRALVERLEKMRVDKPPVPGIREPGTVWVRPRSSPRSSTVAGLRTSFCGIRRLRVCGRTSERRLRGNSTRAFLAPALRVLVSLGESERAALDSLRRSGAKLLQHQTRLTEQRLCVGVKAVKFLDSFRPRPPSSPLSLWSIPSGYAIARIIARCPSVMSRRVFVAQM
jgi:bifunctional non-homologous end joining protein LigD